ncbi:GPO family capsid scaffolding protein, partial [Escherichia coli]|nr:GPO family capsid scaffolding protein [Escherichia coli]
MTVKVKRFRIGVEGATTDGREIQREWLEQMAASYNPTVYTALINLEHIKSYLPDPNFATTMLNALAGKQPLDNTLTNLSGKDVAGLLAYLG